MSFVFVCFPLFLSLSVSLYLSVSAYRLTDMHVYIQMRIKSYDIFSLYICIYIYTCMKKQHTVIYIHLCRKCVYVYIYMYYIHIHLYICIGPYVQECMHLGKAYLATS